MAEKRRKISTICAKFETGKGTKLLKIELFPASEWADGSKGYFRLRKDRSWDEPKRSPYRSAKAAAQYIASLVRDFLDGTTRARPPRREVHRLEPCWVDCGPEDPSLHMQLDTCCARIVSEDSVIGEDGRQYVVVSAPELGGVRLMAIDDLRFYDRQGAHTNE